MIGVGIVSELGRSGAHQFWAVANFGELKQLIWK
jgi:hypothetical protein